MVAATLSVTEERKHAQAKRLSKRMGEIRVTYHPNDTVVVSANDTESDPTSKGHVFEIDGAEHGAFPSFGFSVLVDGRHNGGDVAQSVVNELFAIANAYMEVAKRNARRLNREPKPIAFRWEDLVSEIDWEEDAKHDAWEASLAQFKNEPGTKSAEDAGRVKHVLPNGDLVIDGESLYRVMAGNEVDQELQTKADAEQRVWLMNSLRCGVEYSMISYAELATKAECVA